MVNSRNSVTKQDVENLLAASEVLTQKIGEKSTVVCVTLPSGFVLIESSSCVDPINYDEELGRSLALKKIEDQIWLLEAYLLQVRLEAEDAQ